jgi:hypothetical protein
VLVVHARVAGCFCAHGHLIVCITLPVLLAAAAAASDGWGGAVLLAGLQPSDVLSNLFHQVPELTSFANLDLQVSPATVS